MAEPPRTGHETRWEALVGFFVGNKLVVFIAASLLIVAGLAYAPFRWDIGGLPRDPIPVDALPDISENQQIVFTEWPGRSPRDVEDQITYPLTAALLGMPGVQSVRSSSAFGFSSIYVIFEDGTDFYWSRSRVLEKLASLPPGTLPDGVMPKLGPDATALGQVFGYTLEPLDARGEVVPGVFDLHELRALQDWDVRPALQSVAGVSEVASVGGHVREYQVDVDPESLLAHDVTISQVANAVRKANLDVGARTLEINNVEYMIRGLGFVEDIEDLEQVVITARGHTPIRVQDVGTVGFGPALRRGVLDKGGAEVVGGIVVVRFGENPMAVIDRLRAKIAEITPGLPRRTAADGRVARVEVVPFYDRTGLIHETLNTLSLALIQQILITVVVVLLIMRNLRSSLLISALLPLGVLGTFVLMKFTGVNANVMALAGIAIAIGTMVDIGIVFTENMVRHLDEAPEGEPSATSLVRGAGEVGPAVMTSILTTILGFIPVFGLEGAEGKLFTPLAYTKTYAIVAAFVLAVVVLPPLAHLSLRAVKHRFSNGTTRWKAMLHRSFVIDWIAMGVGLLLLTTGRPLAGAVVSGIAAIHLAEPLLASRWRDTASAAGNALTIAAVGIALVDYWLPLGPGQSFAANAVFVVAMVAVVWSGLWAFGKAYPTLLSWCLRHKITYLSGNVFFVLLGALAWLGAPSALRWLPSALEESPAMQWVERSLPGLPSDFMPSFEEGSFLYMPTTTPHASLGQAKKMLAHIDAAIASIPEVEQVVGKLGRADSPLDPAPTSMIETVVNYRPEFQTDDRGRIMLYRHDDDRDVFVRDPSGALIPDDNGVPFRQWRSHIQSPDDIWREIVAAAEYPGLTGAPKLMPIKTRIVMLQTGMRAAVGIKIKGSDLETIEQFGLDVERVLKGVPEIDASTVYADRIVGKPYLEIAIDRTAISRLGLTIEDVQDVIQVAVGGRVLTRTVEGRERYAVRVRYMREERDTVMDLRRIMVAGTGGEQVPLEQLADLRYTKGPQMIRSEDTFANGYVTFDPAPGFGDVEAAEAAQGALDASIAAGSLDVPDGVSFRSAGNYENQVRARRRLGVLVPVALAVIFVILYLQFRSTATALMVFFGVALAGAGGFLALWLYGQPWFLSAEVSGVDLRGLFAVGPMRLTVAVWVGFLALFGIATDNGVIVATYLTQQFRGYRPTDRAALRQRIIEAGQRRVRPCLMTTATTLLALLPVVTSQGRGADLMVPMALPMIGGVGLSLVTLITVPVLFSVGQERRHARESQRSAAVGGSA